MNTDVFGELTFVVIGVSILLNLIFSTMVATKAEKRNQSWALYFIVGLVFGFAVAILFILLHDAIHRHWRAEDRHTIEVSKQGSHDSTVF
jgi:multisubunit Na+/H+ antiporter MnhB subunit